MIQIVEDIVVYIWVPFHGILVGSWVAGDELIVGLYHLPIFVCKVPRECGKVRPL